MEAKGLIVEINAVKFLPLSSNSFQQAKGRRWEYAPVIRNNRPCFFTISCEKLSREKFIKETLLFDTLQMQFRGKPKNLKQIRGLRIQNPFILSLSSI
jgi:hypothetical protein